MKNCVIKFFFKLPAVAIKENIIFAFIDPIIETFGNNINVQICNNKSNEDYYYLIFDSFYSYNSDEFQKMIKIFESEFKDISYKFDIDYKSFYNNDIILNLCDNYKIINGIIEQIIEV
jgi:hypothetical protein